MCVDHREILMLGSRSTEGFVNTGNPTGTPFSTASDTYMPYGVHPLCELQHREPGQPDYVGRQRTSRYGAVTGRPRCVSRTLA